MKLLIRLFSIPIIVLEAIGDCATMLLFGGYALDKSGRPIIRFRKDGTPFYVKEPGLLKELLGVAFGGASKRDMVGVPITDNHGNVIKYPSLVNKHISARFKNNKTKTVSLEEPVRSKIVEASYEEV